MGDKEGKPAFLFLAFHPKALNGSNCKGRSSGLLRFLLAFPFREGNSGLKECENLKRAYSYGDSSGILTWTGSRVRHRIPY